MRNLFKKLFHSIGLDLRIFRPSTSDAAQFSFLLKDLDINLIFDIGANAGQYGSSLRFLGYKKRIISFEPLTEAHQRLIKAASGDTQWTVFRRVALGSENGQIEINISKNSQSSSILPIMESHTNAEPSSGYYSKESVEIVSLDSIFSSISNQNDNILLKIDTQGFDYNVLQGAKKSLTSIKFIQVEVSFEELYEGQKLFADIQEFLKLYNFELYSLQREFTDTHNAKTLQYNAFFVRK